MGGADVFQIFLSDGFFKYLPDFTGVNEVVIIAEFTEVSSGTKGDTVTTVLGPFNGVADRSTSPAFNKLLYGPKKLESDQVSVTITVLEYDQGENDNTAAFLDFITSASQAFSFVNPVTATERAFTKEIAKTLLTLNKDDIVLRTSFDLVGNSGQLQAHKNNGSFIPLMAGDYVLVNREGCALFTCFAYLSKDMTSANPVAYVGDALLLVPVALRRGLTDTPDNPALKDIETGKMETRGPRLFDNDKAYTDKTWLTLSVVQGGDPSLWDKRKLLLNAEEALQRIGKSTGTGIQKSKDFEVAIGALEAAKKQERNASGAVQLATGVNKDGDFAFTSSDTAICLAHPSTVKGSTIQAHFYRLDDKLPPQLLAQQPTLDTTRATPNNTCYKVAAAEMKKGSYQVALLYTLGTYNQPQLLRYTIDQ